jgi:ABC-type nitrate/sulfonate/bicarbonate transport system permease component
MNLRRQRLEAPALPGPSRSGQGSRIVTDVQGWVVQIHGARHSGLALLAGLAVWEIAGRALHYSFLPPFSTVLGAALDLTLSGQILGYLGASLGSLLLGYGLAVASGVLLGLLMGRYRWVEYMVEPYVNAFLAAPKIVFVPILYALFGVGRGSQVAIVFLSAFFIIVINTRGGIRHVDPSCIDMARAFGASERQLFRKVLLPGALPLTMAGLRLGIGRGVKGMIKGEMFIALVGLGALLRKYGSRFDSARVFAILLVVIGVALAGSFAVRTLERRFTAWTGEGA